MFKVTENGDGSTSIFCNKTGELLFRINDPSRKHFSRQSENEMCLFEPSLQLKSGHFDIDSKSESESDDEDKSQTERRSVSPVFIEEESNDDIPADCISPDDFARCLNLVPTEKLKNEPLDQLKTVFPVRKLSRINDNRGVKFPDDLPLTSHLGHKILQLNPQKHFYSDHAVSLKVNNYDNFCRNELSGNHVNFPKLRCREKRDYPVCVSQKVLRVSSSHMFSFNKKQRLERLITIETGLSPRSRKLLKQCNKKPKVKLRKLPVEEISVWLSRSRSNNFMCVRLDETVSSSDSDATVIDDNSFQYARTSFSLNELSSSSNSGRNDKWKLQKLNFEGAFCDTTSLLKERRKQHPSDLLKLCSVKLYNVLDEISECGGSFYVNGTNILIPFFSDTSESFHCLKQIKSTNNKEGKLRECSKYHNGVENSLNQLNVKRKIPVVKEIPVVDLTNDSAPSSPADASTKVPPVPECSVRNYVFRCYACNTKNIYRDKTEIMATVRKHFHRSHCVKNLRRHLKSYLDTNTLCRTLVAFPEFRRS